MKQYSYIFQLFSSILGLSSKIEGRLYWAPQMGLELNSDQLNQVLGSAGVPKKYPLALLMPPRNSGKVSAKEARWENVRLTLLFLTTTYYTGSAIASRNPATNTSLRPVQEDWDDMKVVADDFAKALRKVHDEHRLFASVLRLTNPNAYTTPISFAGLDRVSGVRLDIEVEMFVPCELTDINAESLSTINLPEP